VSRTVRCAWAVPACFLVLLGGCRPYTEPPVLPEGDPQYVGSYPCRLCHEEEYNKWEASLHSHVINDPQENPEYLLGDFGHITVDEEAGTYIEPDFAPDDIALMHGLQWKQRYIDSEWAIQTRQWNVALQEWAPFDPTHGRTGDWRTDCAGCHSVNFDPETKTWTELNVGCESCHGPGGHHVEVKEELKHATIVNPADLTPLQSASICGLCHTRGTSPDGENPHPVGFMPGQVLGRQHFLVVGFEDEKRWWPSGHLRSHRQQFPDWQQSVHAEAGIGCVECHDSHGNSWKYQLDALGDRLCRRCHSGLSTDPIDGHAPLAGAPQHSNCRGCHMPRVGKSAIVGDDSSHRFDVIEPQVTIDLGGGDTAKQPNSCNSCHAHEDDEPERLQRSLDLPRERLAAELGEAQETT